MKPLLLFLTGLLSTGFFLIEAKNFPEDHAYSNNNAAYITVWKTNNPGISNNNQILIPAEGDFTYLWNEVDNVMNNGSGTGSGPTTITFPEPGTYRLHITPTGSNPFHRIEFGDETVFNPTNDRFKLLKVEQWGDVVWSSFYKAYNLCRNTDFTADDTPNLSNVTDMSFAFWNAELVSINNLNNWDVSNVTNMRFLFADNPNFNQDIGNWDVSNVTNMIYMFGGSLNFNQDIGNWDVGNVTDMSSMFFLCKNFNQPIGNWNVSNVTSMKGMFFRAENFNQPIGNWDVSSVTDMYNMFGLARNFNQPLSEWDVGNVINMKLLFNGARAFNQPIGNWDVSNVTDMQGLFLRAEAFNQPLKNWDVSKVTIMSSMFMQAKSFNQPIDNWDVSNVTIMSTMFHLANNFNQPLENWDVSNVTDMEYIFVTAKNFDQSLAKWNLKSLGTGEDDEDWFSDYDDEIPEGPIFSFYNSGMSCENYSHTLFGWANNPDTPEELKVDMRDMEFAPIVEEFRDYLINDLNWEFEGDTLGDCVIVLSSEKQDFTGFQFYPNPVQSHLYLSADKIMDNISLYNLSGQRILEVQPNASTTVLNTDALAPGIYLMEVEVNRILKTYKVVKE